MSFNLLLSVSVVNETINGFDIVDIESTIDI